jgi:hypothetical protein
MNIAEQIQKVAVNTFLAILPASADDNAAFRMLLTVKVGDEVKPLLLIGNVHGKIEDGHVLAVLNPDKELCEQFIAGVAYTHGILKEIVAKRCDLAILFWIDAYMKVNPVKVYTKYQAKESKPSKFVVK